MQHKQIFLRKEQHLDCSTHLKKPFNNLSDKNRRSWGELKRGHPSFACFVLNSTAQFLSSRLDLPSLGSWCTALCLMKCGDAWTHSCRMVPSACVNHSFIDCFSLCLKNMAAGVTLSSWGRVSIHKVPWEDHVTSCGGCGVPLHVVLMVAVVETPLWWS